MSFADRPKKKQQLWKKALVHFALCFVTGFFTGFAPPSTATLFSGRAHRIKGITLLPAPPITAVEQVVRPAAGTLDRTLVELPRSVPASADHAIPRGGGGDGDDAPPPFEAGRQVVQDPSRRVLIVVTTTRSDDRLQGPLLRRLAHTLRLVPPPLLWIVVQAQADSAATAAVLRDTGVMYRHLTFKENFSNPAAEADHQRNVALSHVEYHRLSGIVHFAGASNVYDLRFFQEIRDIEVFGTWPVAMVSTNRKRVVVDGPICQSSKVQGWIMKDSSNDKKLVITSKDINPRPPKINISGFAFNSSILWDPERWGRPTSLPDTSQDSFKFVHQVMQEDDAKLKGIPADCSRIMVWHLYVPPPTPV